MPAVVRGAGGARGATAPRGGKSRAPARAPAREVGRLGAGFEPRTATIAACGVVGVGLVLMLATGGRAHALGAAVHGEISKSFAAAGLKLTQVRLQGVSPVAQDDVVRAAGVTRGEPMLDLDLAAVRERVEQVGWVKSARVARLLPDTLSISVVERQRLAVWQMNGRAQLIDVDGHPIPEADAARFSDLPLVVGEGANEAAAAILPLIQTRPRLYGRLDALVRVDARRWDLRLKDGGIIQLPARGEDSALIQLDQLDQRSRLLELGFARIDLRDPELVTVRPRGPEAATSPAGAAASNTAL